MREILITNDDGFEANGILELANKLKNIAKVTIIAPNAEKSACSHSITITKPLKLIKLADDFYKVDDGTPSDCIFLGLHTLFHNKKPDLIISGINHGANLAEDITYSGTCGGAIEGVLHGVPSLAVSQYYTNLDNLDFRLACDITLELVEKIFKQGFPLPKRKILNLNIPAVKKSDYKGIKVVPAGYKHYYTDAKLHKNPRGIEYYWLGATSMTFDKDLNKGTDLEAIVSGYASLTPLTLNLTEHNQMENLKKWL